MNRPRIIDLVLEDVAENCLKNGVYIEEYIRQLEEEHQLMKSYLIELVRWNSHGYVGAKKLLDKINQITQESEL